MGAELINSIVPPYVFLVPKVYCYCYYYYYYSSYKIDNEMGGECSAYGGEQRGIQGFDGET
jgi:hypothetical protein